jgi:hypothetical protein
MRGTAYGSHETLSSNYYESTNPHNCMPHDPSTLPKKKKAVPQKPLIYKQFAAQISKAKNAIKITTQNPVNSR